VYFSFFQKRQMTWLLSVGGGELTKQPRFFLFIFNLKSYRGKFGRRLRDWDFPPEFSFLSTLITAWVFSSGQLEVLAHASSSRPVQRESKKQARIPRDVRVVFSDDDGKAWKCTLLTTHFNNGKMNFSRGHLPGRSTKGAKVHRRALASTSI